LYHQSLLPLCCYDKRTKKITLNLITSKKFRSVFVLYGDPFMYRKTDQTDSQGDYIWEWSYREKPLAVQYFSDKKIIWQVELTKPKTKRLKYLFVIQDEESNTFIYTENGVQELNFNNINTPHNHFFYPFIHDVDAIDVPEWVENTIWYEIFPERFCNGKQSISPPFIEGWETGTPKPNNFFGGDLYGILEKLSYIKELGVTGIYLTPVFESPSNHKYNIEDYFSVDKHFGDLEILKKLVSKAHELGIKVMLDAVFNHIGSKHIFWQDVLLNQEKSKYKDYFHIHEFPVLEYYEDKTKINYDTFAFSMYMPKWNTENPDARKYLIDAAIYWIKECDIDGWRLDVADEVSFSFWKEFRQAVRQYKKDLYIMAEVWHDPSKWINGGYFDAVMNYPLGMLIQNFFNAEKPLPDRFTEDVFNRLMKFSEMHVRVQFNLLDSHDTVRALTLAKGDKLKLKNSFLFMMLMKGAPCIYYGTEVGIDGAKDPGCRKPMVWEEEKQDKDLLDFFNRIINFRKEYNDLIQNAAIFYTRNENICIWKLSYKKEELKIVYNFGDSDIKLNMESLLKTKNENVSNILPAKTVAVCSYIGT